MNRNKLIELIKENENITNFGTSDNAPASEWINKAEQALGVTLPDDYTWFLSKFGGGEICGEEIYSIYGVPFDEAVGGDLVYQNTVANNNVFLGKIVLSNTDFDEEFYFKINDFDKVYIAIGNKEELYAEDFIEYLCKRLISYI